MALKDRTFVPFFSGDCARTANCINSLILPRSGKLCTSAKKSWSSKLKQLVGCGEGNVGNCFSVPLLLSSILLSSSLFFQFLHFLKDVFSLATCMYLAVFLR